MAPSIAGDVAAALPPTLAGVQRQLLLAACSVADSRSRVAELASPPIGEDHAIRLAAELARLIDQVETEGLDFGDLQNLVPEDYAEHWQITLDFLRIVTEAWPRILQDLGCIGPAERRRCLAELQSAAWRARPPAAPVIAAGEAGGTACRGRGW